MANNGAVQRPIFQPALRVVTDITNAFECVVTTSFDNNFFTGDIVRIIIPLGWGMQQINGQFSAITVLTPTTFSMSIDTTNYDVFNDPNNDQFAQCIPIAEVNGTVYGATYNTLPSLIRVP